MHHIAFVGSMSCCGADLQMLRELHGLPLFADVATALEACSHTETSSDGMQGSDALQAERLCLLLLLLPSSTWDAVGPQVQTAVISPLIMHAAQFISVMLPSCSSCTLLVDNDVIGRLSIFPNRTGLSRSCK